VRHQVVVTFVSHTAIQMTATAVHTNANATPAT
jgi:hypothetical protein